MLERFRAQLALPPEYSLNQLVDSHSTTRVLWVARAHDIRELLLCDNVDLQVDVGLALMPDVLFALDNQLQPQAHA